MEKKEPFMFVPFKAPRKLIEKLDIYAAEHCDGNRSLAIRQAIRLLIQARKNVHRTSSGK